MLFLSMIEGLVQLCRWLGRHTPVVFICHAHGDPQWERWITRWFPRLLRMAGIRVIIDRMDNGPGACINDFMDQILSVEHVIVMGTSLLHRKTLPGSTHTVAQEASRISHRLRTDGSAPWVIPILLEGTERTSLPRILWGRVYVDLRDPDQYHAQLFDLILQLYGLLDYELVQDWRDQLRDSPTPI